MTEILDHAITVRDAMYVCLGLGGLLVLGLFAAQYYLHRIKWEDQKRYRPE